MIISENDRVFKIKENNISETGGKEVQEKDVA